MDIENEFSGLKTPYKCLGSLRAFVNVWNDKNIISLKYSRLKTFIPGVPKKLQLFDFVYR